MVPVFKKKFYYLKVPIKKSLKAGWKVCRPESKQKRKKKIRTCFSIWKSFLI